MDIIPKLKSCEILEHGPVAIPPNIDIDAPTTTDIPPYWDRRRQVIKLGFPWPNVRSEFRSDYTPVSSILITGTGGGLSVLNGEWALIPLSETQTRVVYRARMKSALPVPTRFIRKRARKDMPITLYNLKHMAEGTAR